MAGAEDGADGVAGRRPGAAGQAAHAQDAAHFESFKGGCNCIKICLPGKSIPRDYFQENRTSRGLSDKIGRLRKGSSLRPILRESVFSEDLIGSKS